jgi:putative tryptophan/tyrosine transport system substrate-binding protein
MTVIMLNRRLFQKRTRYFRLFFVMVLASLLLNGCGQQKPRIFRVGILCGLDVFIPTIEGFKKRMTELGYVEGKNIVYDVHQTNFDAAAEMRILRKFVADRVDLMLVFPSEIAVEAKAVTQGTGVPVVFCQTNIEGTNLINSITEPGGNITGVRYPGPDIALKRLEILHAIAPHAKRIWVPYTTKALIVPPQLSILRPAAEKAGITLVESPADSAEMILADLEKRAKTADIGIDAILFISEPLTRKPSVFKKIGEFASQHRIPMGGAHVSSKGYSTVFGVATDNMAVGKLAAQQANKVLRGIPAGTIPVVSAESYFQLNYKVAQQLGLTVPTGLLKQADEIIR